MTEAQLSAAPTGLYVCRLISPRPSFPADITAAEREVMGRHSQYWRTQADLGTVVVIGPVGDRAGVYGLGVLRCSDPEALTRLLAADPAIVADIGFRYLSAPMLSAILPEGKPG
jgi:hypothetical protein